MQKIEATRWRVLEPNITHKKYQDRILGRRVGGRGRRIRGSEKL